MHVQLNLDKMNISSICRRSSAGACCPGKISGKSPTAYVSEEAAAASSKAVFSRRFFGAQSPDAVPALPSLPAKQIQNPDQQSQISKVINRSALSDIRFQPRRPKMVVLWKRLGHQRFFSGLYNEGQRCGCGRRGQEQGETAGFFASSFWP